MTGKINLKRVVAIGFLVCISLVCAGFINQDNAYAATHPGFEVNEELSNLEVCIGQKATIVFDHTPQSYYAEKISVKVYDQYGSTVGTFPGPSINTTRRYSFDWSKGNGSPCHYVFEITINYRDGSGASQTDQRVVTVKFIDHKNETVSLEPATTSKTGSASYKCTVCNATTTEQIAAIKSVGLKSKEFVFNNKTRKAAVQVFDTAGKALIKGKDYTVTYSKGCKNVGKYQAVVKFEGKYEGSKTLTFKIIPAKKNIAKVTPIKKGMKVKWAKPTSAQLKQITGYEIRYSTSSSMSKAKTVKVTKKAVTSKTIKNLKANKKYYVQMRPYKKIKDQYYYSKWSTKKSVRIK